MSPEQLADPERHWQAEYDFWYRLISGEVERLRFNEGFEPIEADLYPTKGNSKISFAGVLRIGRRSFRAVAFNSLDSNGNKVLRLVIHVEH